MHINPDIFIIARSPFIVVWNYKDHTQFELDSQYSTRLIQLVEDPSSFDSTLEIDSAFLAAGLFSHDERPQAEWGWDVLSKIFHVGTKNLPLEQVPRDIHEWSAQYLDHCEQVLDTQPPADRFAGHYSSDELICLPAPELERTGNALTQVLLDRKTSRSFSPQAITLDDLSVLLYLSLGYLKEREGDTDACVPAALRSRRSSPSGGGLNACEGYVYAARIEGLDPGLYYYHPDRHALRRVHSLSSEPLGQLLAGQHFINELPLGLFLTARFDKLWWKYEHSRAYRMAYVEAGHISQTFQLAATSLGLATWLTGALCDEQVEQLLGLEGTAEQPLFFVGSGYGDGQTQCKELKALIELRERQQ
ncbi:SagB family peptide dehydrogenase [Pseudomonas frederiksbergensis]|uniref:Dehydrogenase n=1 Tax=Pseudomonas frederiksbergensis TaxID=104087 RepID=A0A423KRE5_9PSED|nr:SagB family peptide dehydrogenase [Pseudomonas frederiksbergensis]RON57929.1 dehydrogenase [Pseudomonas frederiksbergensis]